MLSSSCDSVTEGTTTATGSASEGIAQLLDTMSSQKKSRLKRNLENDSIFDAATSASSQYPPPPPSSANRSHGGGGGGGGYEQEGQEHGQQQHEEEGLEEEDQRDSSLHRSSKIRRMNNNGTDEHFDRLTADLSPQPDLDPNQLMACLETPMKLAWGGRGHGINSPFPDLTTTTTTTLQKKRPQSELLSSLITSPNGRMTTRQRGRVPSMSSETSIDSTLTGHTSPIEQYHQAPPGYLSPLPEKSSKRRNALPSHPASCSPYKTRSQSRCEGTMISADDRRDIRFAVRPFIVSLLLLTALSLS
jgi:hypothetical protein